jgi:alanine-synthesizing transaminase
VTQGTGFNWVRPDHFRLVFLPDTKMLADAIGSISDYLEDVRERA